LTLDKVRDVEDLYGSTGTPLHIPIDKNESVDITKLAVDSYGLANGTYYVRLRYRNNNLDWSNWSDTLSFTVEGSTDGDPEIGMQTTTVKPTQEFTVSYSNVVEGKDAWIGIYHKFEEPSATTPSSKWAYATGSNGKITFSLDNSDEYYAVLFKDGGYTEACARIPFFVGSTIEYSTDKTIYEVGEPVTVSYSNAPALSDDWLGIYRMGETPGAGGDTSDSWLYVPKGQNNGSMTLSTGSGSAYQLSKGYYYVSYFTRGYYFEPFQRHYFSVGTEISSVWADKLSFAPNEDVLIHYADGPGTPKDWLGFYQEGKTVGTDELDGFYYTYSATDGTITIPAGSLKSADYFVSLYINDSYDEVSNRIHVSIGKAPSLTVQTKADAPQVVITYESNQSWCDSITSVSLDGVILDALTYRIMHDHIDLTIPGLSNGIHSLSIEAAGWQKDQVNFNSTLTGIKDVSSLKDVTWTIVDQKLTIYNEDGNYRKARLCSPTGIVLKEYPLLKGENSFDLSSVQPATLLLTLESASTTHSQLIFK
ncbi:MAG: hemoblobin-interacting domain-containing protein, partial [Bacteroidaceae bacterium]